MRSILAFALFAALPAQAADITEIPEAEVPVAVEARDFILDLGLGAQLQPEFPGASQYEVVPWPIFDLRFLRLPFFGEVVDGQVRVFSLYPSIAIIGDRDEDDAAFLEGTEDVDIAVELGGGAAVRYNIFRAFAEVRYGVTGHSGFVFDLGGDVILNPFDRLEISAGPRVSLATEDVMDTYFGVEQSALRLPPFEPDGGFKDVGLEVEATYAITENLRLRAKAEYTRFVGDAEDSPIVEAGDTDQFLVGVGLSYRFGADLY